MTNQVQKCIHCGQEGTGSFCSNCGQSFSVKRLSIKNMIHEVAHFFTHFDKGLPFTIKKLAITPGAMQREYVDGYRQKYQKPFSTFFLCATIAALALYWFNIWLKNFYDAGDPLEAAFFHRYWVILQVCLLPFYAFITWAFFKNSGMNFAEIVVLQLYLFSFLFLVLVVIHTLKFIFPHLQTRYIELPTIVLYGMITNLKFFRNLSKTEVAIKTVLCIAINFFMAAFVQDLLVKG